MRSRDELLAPSMDRLVKQIKGQTGSEPDLTELKTAVEEAFRARQIHAMSSFRCKVASFSLRNVSGRHATLNGRFETKPSRVVRGVKGEQPGPDQVRAGRPLAAGGTARQVHAPRCRAP